MCLICLVIIQFDRTLCERPQITNLCVPLPQEKLGVKLVMVVESEMIQGKPLFKLSSLVSALRAAWAISSGAAFSQALKVPMAPDKVANIARALTPGMAADLLKPPINHAVRTSRAPRNGVRAIDMIAKFSFDSQKCSISSPTTESTLPKKGNWMIR